MFRLDTSHPAGAFGWGLAPTRPDQLLTCDARTLACELTRQGSVVRRWSDPLAALEFLDADARALPPGDRWVGYLGYDLGKLFERLPMRAADDLNLPLFAFGLCVSGDTRGAALAAEPAETPATGETPVTRLAPGNFSREEFERAVARAIEYIRAGDVFQVNLAQRLARPLLDAPAEVYRRLRERTPAWYGALLEFPGFALASNSPELFLRVDAARRIITRPIKGTRPRAAGMDEQLRVSIKDQAELAMIVDLHRNDIGRACEIGSVRVTEPRVIETHPTVYHGVATIEGQLRPNVGLVELLRSTFPPGSVTGCPKIRSIEIIDELEPHRRGVYCGVIGYLARGGEMQFNVAIRTMTLKDGIAYIPVGGGVVADSTPEGEYDETLVKARAMLAAVSPSF